ncbi:MAG TPA: hypothetical protein VK511_12430 [Gemmatimonadaceae bacterium]|nr:hypothetical protein [Gemmatimonadaceae bacterium]
MNKSFHFGRMIFATAMAGLAVQCMLRGNAVPALEPVSSSSSLPLIGWITGVVLFAAAVATLVYSKAYYGAAVIAAMLLLWVLLLHAPALVAAPRNGGEWTGAFETFALSGAALLLFGLMRSAAGYEREPEPIARRAATIGRIMYGVSMPAFGVLHFIYIAYVASVIPSWIPAHVFFGYATGVAHVASGLGILTGVLSRIAAYCTAAMFGSWVLIVHAPRVLANFRSPNEWTSMLIAAGMCGGALLIASALSNIPNPSASLAESASLESRPTVLA